MFFFSHSYDLPFYSGNSTQKIRLLAEPEPPKKSISEKFAELPESSQTAVYAGSAAGGALLIAILGFLCFKKRRQGRREAAAYRAKQEAMDQEDQRWNTELKAKGISPDALGHTGADSKDVVGATVAAAPVRTNSFGSPRSEDQNKFPEPAYSPPQNTSNGGYNEVFQPQPRANTNGSWAGGDMNRTASVASSQWGPAQPASPQSPHFGGQQQYGRLPANNGYNYNNGF